MSKERKKRRRFVAAAITANSMGAAAGLVTQMLISDPTTSVLVGTVVSGSVGDILLQAVEGAPEESDEQRLTDANRASKASIADSYTSHRGGARCIHRDHLPVQSARARRGDIRCDMLTRTPQASPNTRQDKDRSAPARDDQRARVPLHPRHRQLHRAAQRRMRTQHSLTSGDGHGTS
ncbi:hypothetical protein [Streptomyces collinus]|uniref:hypothetical protein n=1 Tax=Streptomyces collinus TaxID=42684 RepID=UPI0036B7E9E8